VTTLMTLVTAGLPLHGERRGPAITHRAWSLDPYAGVAVLFPSSWANYLPKTRSSFIFGVRNTLDTVPDIAWEKTTVLPGPVHDCGRPGLIARSSLSRPPSLHCQLNPPLILSVRADPVRLLLFRCAAQMTARWDPASLS